MRDLPDEVAAALPAEALEMDAAPGRGEDGLRDPRPRHRRHLDAADDVRRAGSTTPAGRPELVVTATASLDPRTAAFGRPLDKTAWDVTARNELLGAINQRGLRTSMRARSAVQDGHVYVAYRNKSGMLSIDVDQTMRSLSGSAPLDPDRVRSAVRRTNPIQKLLQRGSPYLIFELPFTGVATRGPTAIPGTVVVGSGAARPARIVARPDGAWLESSAEQRPGTYPLMLGFHGRDIDSGLSITIGRERRRQAFSGRPGP